MQTDLSFSQLGGEVDALRQEVALFRYGLISELTQLEPNHRGAHEYVGIAHLKVKNLDKAKEHLARLETICGKTCEEYEDLAKAVAAYKP